MKYMMIILACIGMLGCVTTDSDTISGWSFRTDSLSKSSGYAQSVVKKEDGHPVRSGEKSIRFEVRPGDCKVGELWNDCAFPSERSEKSALGYESGENWYHYSIYLPEDYPVLWQARATMLGQFHYEVLSDPPFMFWATGRADIKNKKYVETYSVESQTFGSTGSDELLELDDMRGRWTDILIHANWTTNNDGFFRVYVNGSITPSYNYSGTTLLKRYRDVYFKFGIYRFSISDTPPIQIVYYDDVRRGRSCKDVTTYFDCSKLVVE